MADDGYKTTEEALEALIEAAGPLTLVGEGIATLDERDLSHQEAAVSFGDLDEHTRIQINQEWGVFVRLYEATLKAKAFLLEQQLRQKTEHVADVPDENDTAKQTFLEDTRRHLGAARDVDPGQSFGGMTEPEWRGFYVTALHRGGATTEQIEYFLNDEFDYTKDPVEVAHQTLLSIGKVTPKEPEDKGDDEMDSWLPSA